MLHAIAVVSLAVSLVCAAAIALDIARGCRQPMAIMNAVWPITALYAGPIALYAYFTAGRSAVHGHARHAGERRLAASAALGATHCGAGCTLGDIVAEPVVAVLGLTLLGKAIFAAWLLDYVLAFAIGIAFQYFTLAPMRGLGVRDGIVAAVKADALSLTAWQAGMYGWMALVVFVFLGHELDKSGPVFWFMMQLAMLAGFLTSWPVNAWLIRAGLKEAM